MVGREKRGQTRSPTSLWRGTIPRLRSAGFVSLGAWFWWEAGGGSIMDRKSLAVMVAFVLVCGVCAAEFRAGVAKRSITPDPLLPVSGGVGKPTPTTKALGDLSV